MVKSKIAPILKMRGQKLSYKIRKSKNRGKKVKEIKVAKIVKLRNRN